MSAASFMLSGRQLRKTHSTRKTMERRSSEKDISSSSQGHAEVVNNNYAVGRRSSQAESQFSADARLHSMTAPSYEKPKLEMDLLGDALGVDDEGAGGGHSPVIEGRKSSSSSVVSHDTSSAKASKVKSSSSSRKQLERSTSASRGKLERSTSVSRGKMERSTSASRGKLERSTSASRGKMERSSISTKERTQERAAPVPTAKSKLERSTSVSRGKLERSTSVGRGKMERSSAPDTHKRSALKRSTSFSGQHASPVTPVPKSTKRGVSATGNSHVSPHDLVSPATGPTPKLQSAHDLASPGPGPGPGPTPKLKKRSSVSSMSADDVPSVDPRLQHKRSSLNSVAPVDPRTQKRASSLSKIPVSVAQTHPEIRKTRSNESIGIDNTEHTENTETESYSSTGDDPEVVAEQVPGSQAKMKMSGEQAGKRRSVNDGEPKQSRKSSVSSASSKNSVDSIGNKRSSLKKSNSSSSLAETATSSASSKGSGARKGDSYASPGKKKSSTQKSQSSLALIATMHSSTSDDLHSVTTASTIHSMCTISTKGTHESSMSTQEMKNTKKPAKSSKPSSSLRRVKQSKDADDESVQSEANNAHYEINFGGKVEDNTHQVLTHKAVAPPTVQQSRSSRRVTDDSHEVRNASPVSHRKTIAPHSEMPSSRGLSPRSRPKRRVITKDSAATLIQSKVRMFVMKKKFSNILRHVRGGGSWNPALTLWALGREEIE